MAYILGTGYFNANNSKTGLDWFARIWLQNTVIWPCLAPERIVVISVGDSKPPYVQLARELELNYPHIDVIDLKGNLGHVHQLIGKQMPRREYRHCGVTGLFLALAAIAYCNECDLIYKEQDCLAFGQWMWKLYDAVSPYSWGMAFGRNRLMGAAQSLFIVRHWFLPEFIKSLIQEGDERDIANLPEHKFTRILQTHPNQVKLFDFGYDRDRPFNAKDPVFYVQKLSPLELRHLAEHGLLELPQSMPNVSCFTNDVTDRF